MELVELIAASERKFGVKLRLVLFAAAAPCSLLLKSLLCLSRLNLTLFMDFIRSLTKFLLSKRYVAQLACL